MGQRKENLNYKKFYTGKKVGMGQEMHMACAREHRVPLRRLERGGV